jgi:cyclopropane fatty-acyl-phospholipid synthase-like methyltransferase
MAVPFDHISLTYDSVFTRSAIGQLQRKHVWNYIEKIFPELDGLEMLELNAGYGEDAIMFSERGFNLIATDVSAETFKVTEQKAEKFSMRGKVTSQYLDLDSFNEMLFDKKFDLIFSNFGGLNCINPEALEKLFAKLPQLLNPNGRFIAVVMPRFCLWETIYYTAKFQFKKAFRRWTAEEVISDVYGTTLKTWYYKPSQIRKWVKSSFNVVKAKPIGLALPPFYLDSFFLRKKKLLIGLHKIEKKINHSSLYAGIADHYLIDLKVK